jgi:hypothetical protein
MGNSDEINRIQQLLPDLITLRDRYRFRLEHADPNLRSVQSRSSVQILNHEIIRLNQLIAAHNRQIVRLRTVLS